MEAVAVKKTAKAGTKATAKPAAQAASTPPQYSAEMYKDWYITAARIRRFEERVLEFYGEFVRGFCHVYIGQEAIASGMKSALDPMDCVVTAYRQHGIGLMKGISAREAMAELFGRSTGIVKGKGGSMHFFNAQTKYFGGNGIVGAQIGIGTGLAFAEKYKSTGLLAVTMFGDGAARQGILYEAGNMAMTWQLPVIYVCENNGYAMGTSVARTSNVHNISDVAKAFNMPSEIVDGMDPAAVHEAFTRAAAHIRAGNGPYFLEIKTYRYKGHSVSDPEKYRKTPEGRAETEHYKSIDPIKTTRKKMLEAGMTEADIQAIDDAIEAEMQDAVDFAKASPYPDASDLYEDNYVQADYPFMKD